MNQGLAKKRRFKRNPFSNTTIASVLVGVPIAVVISIWLLFSSMAAITRL